jgi:hypothetical protein
MTDKLDKKKKKSFVVTGTVEISVPFTTTVEADDEDDADSLVRQMGADELIDTFDLSGHEDIEVDSVDEVDGDDDDDEEDEEDEDEDADEDEEPTNE